MAEAAQLHQVAQAALHPVHPLVDEIIRRILPESEGFEGAVEPDQFGAGRFELIRPRPVAGGERREDARLGSLLVLEQQVGDPAVGGDDEDAVVKLRTTAVADEDVFHQLAEAGHAGSADFFYGMNSHDDFSSSA